MITYERYHEGLPKSLYFTKSGDPRKTNISLSRLSDEDLDTIITLRDKLLNLYFPPSLKFAYKKKLDDRGTLGISSPIGIRNYKPGSHIEFEAPIRGGGSRHISMPIPYVWVPDNVRGRTSIIIDENKQKKEITWRVWERSLNAWLRHFTGGDSLLSFWDERKKDEITCMMFDLDADFDPSDNIGSFISPVRDAIESIEAEFGISLGIHWMLSGSKGVWCHGFYDKIISREAVACIMTEIGLRMQKSGCKVRFGRQSSKYIPYGIIYNDIDPIYNLDDGNIGARACRLPFTRHMKTDRIAHYVTIDGVDITNQYDYIMNIERTPADDIMLVAGVLMESWVSQVHWVPTSGPNGRPKACEHPHASGDRPYYISDWFFQNTHQDRVSEKKAKLVGNAETADIIDEIEQREKEERNGNNDTAYKVTSPSKDTLIIQNDYKVLTIPQYTIPNTNQTYQLVDDLLSCETSSIDGTESIDDILPIMKGEAYDILIRSGGMLKLYSWMNARGESITIDSVVQILISRYVGNDADERIVRFEAMVKSDIGRGKHIRTGSKKPFALNAEEAARNAGINNQNVIRTLQALSFLHSVDGAVKTTSAYIARMIGVLKPDEINEDKIRAAKVTIGRYIQTLIAKKLISKIRNGHVTAGKSYPSVFKLHIGKLSDERTGTNSRLKSLSIPHSDTSTIMAN